jgi:signal transduction histidine kinase
MDDELGRLEKLVGDFLQFSRLESKKYKPVPESLDIKQELLKEVEAARVQAGKKNVNIHAAARNREPA